MILNLLKFIVKLVNLLFSVCFAAGCIHSGDIKIFKRFRDALLNDSVDFATCHIVVD